MHPRPTAIGPTMAGTSPLFLHLTLLLLLLVHSASTYESGHTGHHHQTHHSGPRPPRIKEHPTSAVVKKHEPVTLSCKADGDPEPVIEWYRDNELVRKSSNHIYLNNGDLFILKVMNHKKERDTGVYFCLARNVHGKAKSHNATLEIALIRDEFRVLPKSVFTAVGDDARLECSPPRGYPEPVIQWKKDGELVNIGGRFRLSDSGNLLVSDVQPEDTGRYQCIAHNMAGQRESPHAHLNVRVKPHFIRKPEDLTVHRGETAEIHCAVSGDPPPKVIWRREGGELSGRTRITVEGSIKISDVTEEDEGSYICEAENLVGKTSASATLIVHTRPNFLVEPKDVRVALNGVARFECKASGNPRPSVFWTKESHQFLMFPDNKYGRFSVTSDGSLVIFPLKKEDQGYYVCSALSVVGSSLAKAYLNITSLTNMPPPIIFLGPADQTLPEHTTGTLPCEARGHPQPKLKWFMNNNQVPTNNPRFNILEDGSLQIDDLQQLDSGEYKCLAYSENGESSWTAQLKVAVPYSTNTLFHRMPDPSTFPAAPEKPDIINVTEHSVTISWHRIGSDGASPVKGAIVEYFSPDHNNEWIRAGEGIVDNKFTVERLKSGSRYHFLVRLQNNHGIGPPSIISYEARTLGTASHSVTRNVDLSEVRRKLESLVVELRDVRAISSSSVQIFWDMKGDHEFIEGFYVRYRAIDPNNMGILSDSDIDNKYQMITVFNGGASSYIIDNLPKFSTFEFFLVPFFQSIIGKPSNTRMVRTLADMPSASPVGIKARPINANSALVTWQPPPADQITGSLLGYIINVQGPYTPYNVNLSVNANITSYLLRNLTSETEYTIQITAYTSMGVGKPSPQLTLIMDSLSDVYSEPKPGMFDSSNVWICVLIISLVILSLIVMLLGFLLYKKRSAILKKNTEMSLNRELKPQSDHFYTRQFEFQKGWQSEARGKGELKLAGSSSIKMSPSMPQTDNNGYSTVTTDDQAADYADYDYVSQHGLENNYESTYDPYGRDGPVAYASSSIISANQPYRPSSQTVQWRTQNFKPGNHSKPNYPATLDRSAMMNSYLMDNRYKKSGVYGANPTNVNEPLIGGHLSEFEDSNHYHYADSVAYGGGTNVTQIPSAKLMANQVKYGSLSRINQQSQYNPAGSVDNYKKKSNGSNEWKMPYGSQLSSQPSSQEASFALINQSQLSSPKSTLGASKRATQVDFAKSRHIISNPLADGTRANLGVYEKMHEAELYLARRKESATSVQPNCDSESAYQELS